jgi:hypothetical protein
MPILRLRYGLLCLRICFDCVILLTLKKATPRQLELCEEAAVPTAMPAKSERLMKEN